MDSEYLFITYLSKTIKTEFNKALGVKNRKEPLDPCVSAYSLDTPLSDESDDNSYGDIIPDPDSDVPFDEIVDNSMQEYIRNTMDTVAADLLTMKQREVYAGLLNDLRLTDIAETSGVTPARVQQQKEDVLRVLQSDPRIMELWLEYNNSIETVEEIAERYMQHVGVGTYRDSGASSVEHAVEMIMRMEEKRPIRKRRLERALEGKLHETVRKQQRRQISEDLAAFERGRASRLSGK